MKNKAQILVASAFAATFGAGIVTALLFLGRPGPAPVHDRGGPGGGQGNPGGGGSGSWIARELSLTPEQHEKMREIWSGIRDQSGARDKRRELGRQRDEEIRALLTPEQLARHEEILAKYEKRQDELREAGEALMRQAEQRTREMLTPEQRTKYEEFLKQRRDDPRGRGPGGPGGPGGPPTKPSGALPKPAHGQAPVPATVAP